MKKLLGIIFTLLLLTTGDVIAQSYQTAFGLRMGNNATNRTFGLTVQQRFFGTFTAEGIVQSDFKHNTTGHVLIEKHYPIICKRFNYYVGAGISFGRESSVLDQVETQQVITTYGNRTIGADLIGGLEFTFMGISASLDYKPNLNLTGREPWCQGQVGISARYVINSQAEQRKRQRRRRRR